MLTAADFTAAYGQLFVLLGGGPTMNILCSDTTSFFGSRKERSGARCFCYGAMAPVLPDNPRSFLGSLWTVPVGQEPVSGPEKTPCKSLIVLSPTFLLLQPMVTAPSLPVVGPNVRKAPPAVCYHVNELVKAGQAPGSQQ